MHLEVEERSHFFQSTSFRTRVKSGYCAIIAESSSNTLSPRQNFQQRSLRLGRASCFCLGILLIDLSLLNSCSTAVPSFNKKRFEYPKGFAYLGRPEGKEFERIGTVRARADYVSLNPQDPEGDPQSLCKNFYNRAVQDLVKFAKEQKADAVIEVKSVVFTMDGKAQTFDRPECADDGAEGQALVQGTAVRWKALSKEAESKTPSH